MREYDRELMKQMLLVMRAADFAARRHVDQRRKGRAREPYLNHLAEVAFLLADTASEPDPQLIAAGWLHDTLEDTATSKEELEALFGKEVTRIVSEVTDDKSLPKAERKRLQVENTAKKSREARLLKLADKTSNLRSLAKSPPEDWDRRRLAEYGEWAKAVVASCRGLNAALEDAFDQAAAEFAAKLALVHPSSEVPDHAG